MKKNELKREYKRQLFKLSAAIKAWCYGCNGYGIDGYGDCGGENCPLYQFRVTGGDAKSEKYKAVFREMNKIKNEKGEIGRGHWDRFFEKQSLGKKMVKKKTNLGQEGGGVE